MSGEDEKTQVSSAAPEVEASNGDPKAEDKKEPVANGDGVGKEKDTKKTTKRKAASNKKVKESSDEEEDEEPKKSPKKKKAPQPKKSPVKKQKKEESSDEEDAEEAESTKSNKKPASPKKGGKDAKKEEDEVMEEEEEEEEELEGEPKKGVPLLDQPLEIEGSRARKKVSRFSFNSAEKEDKKPFSVPEGKGTRLGDIPRIEHFISKIKTDDIKPVAKALFGPRGPVKSVLKKEIRNFNGFDFDENSEQWEKRKAILSKLKLKELKVVCEALDLERSGTVVALTERIMEFCSNPQDSGKKLPQSKRKSKGDSKKSKPKQSKSKAGKGKRASKKDKDISESDSEADEEEEEEEVKKPSGKESKTKKNKEESSADEKDEDVASDKEDEEKDDKSDAVSEEGEKEKEEEEEEAEEEEEKKVKSKKGKKPVAKKAPAKAAKKAPAKKAPAKKKEVSESEEEEKEDKASSSEDDEPLVKIAKPQSPPTDEDIKTFVKKILEGANLEEITMKTVCKQVYENYPDHDLANKKDLIKETVKSLIST